MARLKDHTGGFTYFHSLTTNQAEFISLQDTFLASTFIFSLWAEIRELAYDPTGSHFTFLLLSGLNAVSPAFIVSTENWSFHISASSLMC